MPCFLAGAINAFSCSVHRFPFLSLFLFFITHAQWVIRDKLRQQLLHEFASYASTLELQDGASVIACK